MARNQSKVSTGIHAFTCLANYHLTSLFRLPKFNLPMLSK